MILILALLLAPAVWICEQTGDADFIRGLALNWLTEGECLESVPSVHGGLQGRSFGLGTQAFRFPMAHRSAMLMAKVQPAGTHPGKPHFSDQTRTFFRALTAADRPWLMVVVLWFCALVVGEPVRRWLAVSAGIAFTFWLANQGLGGHFYFHPNALATIWSMLLQVGMVWAIGRLLLWRVVFPGRKRWGLPLRSLVF